MNRTSTQATAVIPAPPADVYAILADYHHAHPQILPAQFFTKLEVEAGGTGAGTVGCLHTRSFGRERILHFVVSEPDPGQVLVEDYPDDQITTTFTVTPVADGQQCRLEISTTWEPNPGIGGRIERMINARVLRFIFHKELHQLTQYVQRQTT